jgi:hypothetical protein
MPTAEVPSRRGKPIAVVGAERDLVEDARAHISDWFEIEEQCPHSADGYAEDFCSADPDIVQRRRTLLRRQLINGAELLALCYQAYTLVGQYLDGFIDCGRPLPASMQDQLWERVVELLARGSAHVTTGLNLVRAWPDAENAPVSRVEYQLLRALEVDRWDQDAKAAMDNQVRVLRRMRVAGVLTVGPKFPAWSCQNIVAAKIEEVWRQYPAGVHMVDTDDGSEESFQAAFKSHQGKGHRPTVSTDLSRMPPAAELRDENRFLADDRLWSIIVDPFFLEEPVPPSWRPAKMTTSR